MNNLEFLLQHGAQIFNSILLFLAVSQILCGPVLIIGGIITNKRKKLGRRYGRRMVQNLIKWDVVKKEEVNGALIAQNLPPIIQGLILNWDRLWGEACIWGGIGIILAGAINTGILVTWRLVGPPLLNLTSLALYIFITAVVLHLFIVGQFAGMGFGLLKGVFKQVPPSEQGDTLKSPQRRVADYRSPSMVLLPATLFLLGYALALRCSVALNVQDTPSLLGLLGILPALTLGILLFCEYLTRRLSRLPPLRLSSDPILAERADRAIFPRLMQILLGIECGIVGVMVLMQVPLLEPIALISGQAVSLIIAFCLLAALCWSLAILVNFLYGRLGGSVTGWPWSRRAG